MRIEHRRAKIATIVAFVLACLGVLLWLFTLAGGRLPGNSAAYRIQTVLPDAFQLVPNADVRRAGVKIGRVAKIDSRGGASVVTIELDRGQYPVYRDGTVLLRTKTLVGENYLDLETGNPRAGAIPDGGTLPLARAGDAVELDQILSGLDRPTRAAVRRDLDALGPGLKGRGADVNRLFAAVAPLAADGGTVMRVLSSQRAELARAVDSTGQVMQALADRTADVRRLARSARTTAMAVASRDQALGAAIEELPSTLRQARRSAGRLGAFSGGATPVVRDLEASMANLRPVFEELRPAAAEGSALFRELPAFVRGADPLLASLRRFSDAGAPPIVALTGLLRQLNPALGYLDPYAGEAGAFFANVGSAVDSVDAVGHRARVHAIFDEGSLTGWSPSARKLVTALARSGGISSIHSLGYNAYPKPGTVGSPQPFSGDYPRLREAP